jgi:hypothetical protein
MRADALACGIHPTAAPASFVLILCGYLFPHVKKLSTLFSSLFFTADPQNMLALLLLAMSNVLVAMSNVLVALQCPDGFTCFHDSQSFVKAVNAPAHRTAKLGLLCNASDPCTISSTQLGDLDGIVATVIMENVVISDNDADGENGALLNIASGSVTGTNLTFRNGSEA